MIKLFKRDRTPDIDEKIRSASRDLFSCLDSFTWKPDRKFVAGGLRVFRSDDGGRFDIHVDGFDCFMSVYRLYGGGCTSYLSRNVNSSDEERTSIIKSVLSKVEGHAKSIRDLQQSEMKSSLESIGVLAP